MNCSCPTPSSHRSTLINPSIPSPWPQQFRDKHVANCNATVRPNPTALPRLTGKWANGASPHRGNSDDRVNGNYVVSSSLTKENTMENAQLRDRRGGVGGWGVSLPPEHLDPAMTETPVMLKTSNFSHFSVL